MSVINSDLQYVVTFFHPPTNKLCIVTLHVASGALDIITVINEDINCDNTHWLIMTLLQQFGTNVQRFKGQGHCDPLHPFFISQ